MQMILKLHSGNGRKISRLFFMLTVVMGVLLFATGCSKSLPQSAFADTLPQFDPIKFWTGHTESWGVMENRTGAPTAIVTTSTDGALVGPDSLQLVQHVFVDGKDTRREWRLRRTKDGYFEATANDMAGIARGKTSGRTFHWTWTLATKPGNHLFNVTMDQWMYLANNGTLLNRTIITKFGVCMAEVTEQFIRQQ